MAVESTEQVNPAEHAQRLRNALAVDFDKNGGDWYLTEDKTGYERRVLIFSESRGRYIGEAVVDIAREYGFDAGDYTNADDEYYCETWDEAGDYLTKLAGDGYSFEQDGDFFAIEFRDLPEDQAVLPMPKYWASYFINGDASGMQPGESAIADAYLEKNDVAEVLDAPGEGYFSWSYGLHGGTSEGGDLLDYIVRYRAHASECVCADCTTGKIQSIAGPGCSLPAHEYTEVDGTACWNCGAVRPAPIDCVPGIGCAK